jgi:integrase
LNPGYKHGAGALDVNQGLDQFEDWLEVVRQYSPVTAKGYAQSVRMVLRQVPSFDYANLVCYLKEFRARYSVGHYSNTLGALKVFTRFIGRPELLEEFAFPRPQMMPKPFWNKTQIQAFYDALTSPKMKALLLMGATTGLRKGEVVGLRFDDVDFRTRAVIPKVHAGTTKHSWASFYNKECEEALARHIATMSPAIKSRGKLFPLSSRDFKDEWGRAKAISQVNLKFKDLRDFFAQSMLDLGVQSIYIDAFSGRAPGSVLAKHYIDLSPQKLKQVYDHAGLKVLS